MSRFRTFLVLCAVAAMATLVGIAPAQAASTVVYDNIPSPQPGNVFSEAFEAQSASEFGGQIQLAGADRSDPVVTVLMSSWGCQSGHWFSADCATTPGATFSEPVTLNLYSVGPSNSVGSLIATTTSTFNIPFRPSASPSCTGGNAGKWFNGSTCFNGFATPISFDLSGMAVTLPTTLIATLAYNTTHYGAAPIGEAAPCFTSSGGCGYDSLNVGLASPPSVGSDPQPAGAYLNSSWGGAYCDGGSGGTGSLRFDTGCWTGFQPAIEIQASSTSDLVLAITHQASVVQAGRNFDYRFTIRNNGPDAAANVDVTNVLQPSWTYVSKSVSGGFSCTTPAAGSTGTVECAKASLASGAIGTITIEVRPTRTGLYSNTASATSDSTEGNPGDESDSDPVAVQPNNKGCTIVGTQGNDVITGTAGADDICAMGGNDQVDGLGGGDVVYGQSGNDTIVDHGGVDQLFGGAGQDTLDTQDGAAGDHVDGQKGPDTCVVDPGDTVAHCP